MKKKYVKPVFFAENFEMTQSVAACGVSITQHYYVPDDQSEAWTDPYQNGWYAGSKATGNMYPFDEKGNEHGKVHDYFNYAGSDDAYLFTTDNEVCDFLWTSGKDKTDQQSGGSIYIWNDTNNRNPFVDTITEVAHWVSSFANFFGDSNGNQSPAVNGLTIES